MPQLRIFSDFDATISIKDVGDALFQTFGDYWTLWDEFADGRIDIRELNRQLCGSLHNVSRKDIAEWARTREIDPYFVPFMAFCEENSVPFTIISDGYDAYIQPILEQLGVSVPVFANTLIEEAGQRFRPQFFGASEHCVCSTASCKRDVILNNALDTDVLVYIGDGHTDYCGAEHCDIVFAKSKLAAYCNAHKIPHYPYKSFFDIHRIISSIMQKGHPKQRNQARNKRRSAFMAE